MANGDISRLSPRGASVNDPLLVQCCWLGSQALFFEVIAEKTDQRCSTLWPPQRGQITSSFLIVGEVKILVNVFLQA